MNPNPTLPELPAGTILAVALFAIWSIVIKGMALYRAGARQDKGWFVALLIVNTAGILELIYLLAVSKRKN